MTGRLLFCKNAICVHTKYLRWSWVLHFFFSLKEAVEWTSLWLKCDLKKINKSEELLSLLFCFFNWHIGSECFLQRDRTWSKWSFKKGNHKIAGCISFVFVFFFLLHYSGCIDKWFVQNLQVSIQTLHPHCQNKIVVMALSCLTIVEIAAQKLSSKRCRWHRPTKWGDCCVEVQHF